MSIRTGTVYYEKFKEHDLNYFKHGNTFCVYIGDVLSVLGQITKRGNYGDVAYRHLKIGSEFLEFKLKEEGWNRVYLTESGIMKLYEVLKEQKGHEISEKHDVIEHCVNTLKDLAAGKEMPEIELPDKKAKKEKAGAVEDSYVIDLLEDIDRRLNSLEQKQFYLVKAIQREMLLSATHDLSEAKEHVSLRSILVCTLQCIIEGQIQNPLSKNKELKEKMKRAATLLSREFKYLDKEDEFIKKREEQINEYKRRINYKGDGDGLEEDDDCGEEEHEETEAQGD